MIDWHKVNYASQFVVGLCLLVLGLGAVWGVFRVLQLAWQVDYGLGLVTVAFLVLLISAAIFVISDHYGSFQRRK